MKTLTVKVPDTLYAEIARAARTRGVTKSEIVRERLAMPGNTPGGAASLWSRMEDLVISEDLLPTDLSSDKEHLKSYGQSCSRGFRPTGRCLRAAQLASRAGS